MLTASMKSNDLIRILSADYDRIVRWGHYRIKELRSELLRGMKDKIWKYYDYHTDNADYIIVVQGTCGTGDCPLYHAISSLLE